MNQPKSFDEEIREVATRVYEILGPGQEEAIYRDAMTVEFQERGYVVKTEMPVSVIYQTSGGKSIIVGAARADIYLEKESVKAVLELKAVQRLLKKKEKDLKELEQLRKYFKALGIEKGALINFPFPPTEQPEIISATEENP